MEVGQDPAQFWNLTLREIEIIIRGAVAGQRKRQNELLTAAWFNAKLSAYAPHKAKDFIQLGKILLRAPTSDKPAKPHWRDVLKKLSSWAKPNKETP